MNKKKKSNSITTQLIQSTATDSKTEKVDTKTTVPSYINFILLSIETLLTIIILVALLLSINKGFDFTDEGGFFISYKNASIYKGGIYNYHIIISKLTNWLDPGIIAYRWMSHASMIFSSFILAFGLHKWLTVNYKSAGVYNHFVFLFCFISIGNFLFYFTGIQSIHYNTLTNVFIQTSTGLIIYLFSIDPARMLKSKINLAIIATIGIICSFSFFVKFPSGILQFGTYLFLFFFFTSSLSLKQITTVIATFLIGTLAGLFIYFIGFQNFSTWKLNFADEFFMLSDHSPKELFAMYLVSSFALINFVFQNFSWLLIFPLFILFSYSVSYLAKLKNKNAFTNTILFVASILFIYQVFHFKFYRSLFSSDDWITGSNAYFYIVVITFQILLCFSFWITNKKLTWSSLKTNKNKFLLLLLLFISPFFGAVGTANSLFLNVLIHLAPWFATILILVLELSKYFNKPLFLPLFLILPSIVTTSQIIDGNIYSPYYSGAGLIPDRINYFQQKELVPEIQLLKGIHLDIKKKNFLLDLKHLLELNNYKKGYPIFGFDIPGVVYALEGVSPGAPYFFNQPRDCKAFDRFQLNNNPPIFLLSKENPIIKELYDLMIKKGILFDDYSLVGEVNDPNGMTLSVLFPRSLLLYKNKR